MGLSLDPINQVYGLRTPEGGLFSRCAGHTSTTASQSSSGATSRPRSRHPGAATRDAKGVLNRCRLPDEHIEPLFDTSHLAFCRVGIGDYRFSIATATVVQPASPQESSSTDNRRLASWLVLSVPLVIVLVGAWSYRWVQEDAFINFRIIGNFLAGHGPVYNVGERVETYSDPLWLFLLAVLHKVLPFISLEWLSVVLGLGGTAAGVILGGRAIQQLGASRGDSLVIPIGLLIFSVVAGVWEFATSGLEMGMTFCWIGLAFWLLVRTECRRDSALWCAFVVGLGTLIRPELALMSVVFLVSLVLVMKAPGWKGPTTRWRRYFLPTLVAFGLPILYELWRMAYFAMVVSNTALAKSGGSSWWSQGIFYLDDQFQGVVSGRRR
jgi:arabinofuranosyltransferase